MKAIFVGTDRKIFEEDSVIRQRMVEYARFFDELHLVVFSNRKSQILNSKSETPNKIKLYVGQVNSKIQISKNIWVYPTNSRNRFFYITDAFFIIKKLIKNSRNDVIISCQDPFETGIVGVFSKLFFNLPLHIQIHTDLEHKYFRELSLLNQIRSMMAEFVLRYADRVRVVSERIKKSISPFNLNIDVLPIKVEIQLLSSEGHSFGREANSLNILTICRLEKEKNLETAIKAFKIVSAKFPNIIFTIVGDGGERKNLESLTKNYNLQSKISFVGWQDGLDKYYRQADIYISTSLYEGYGLSMVEAATYGLPLVISHTGLVGDVFENGQSALVCDAKDQNGFAENILKIISDEKLARELGEKAKSAVEKHLSLSNNYFKNYADSVIKTADHFERRNIFVRVFNFKKTLFNSLIILRYFICGISAASVNILSLYLFTDRLSIWYLYSSVLAFFLALVISFSLQKFVVFRDTEILKIHHQFYRFFIAAILGVITNTVLVFICVDILNIWYILAQVIAGFFVMIQNFLLYKFFIFSK